MEFSFYCLNSILIGKKWENFKQSLSSDLELFHVTGGGKASSAWESLVTCEWGFLVVIRVGIFSRD